MKKLFVVFILTVVCLTTSIFAGEKDTPILKGEKDKPEYLKFVIFSGYYDEDKNIKDEYQTMTIDSLSIRSWRISAVHDYYDTPRFDLAISAR